MRLPHGVIQGSSEYTIIEKEDNKYILLKINEKLNLVRSIDNKFLKNRKLITDLLEFLDSRKPITIGINEWNDILQKRLTITSLPGMGQFDIDGLDNECQSELLSISQRLITVAFIITLSIGLFFGTIVMNKLFLYQVTEPNNIDF